MNNRLALGTVQFGLPYGIANQGGQLRYEEVVDIIEHARMEGMDTLDTAIAYGESEQRLGDIGVKQWRVVTKLPSIPESCTDIINWVQESVANSLGRLKIQKLHGLLLHHSQQLLGQQGDTLYRALLTLKEMGKVDKIGVSIYDPDELDALWLHYQFDLVQAPFNIFDRRLATTGWLTRLNKANIEVHVRSIFLQGLLLMEPAILPNYFSRWQSLWNEWQQWLYQQSTTPVKGCLGFVMSHPEINRVVVGVDSLKQLQEILAGVEASNETLPESLMSQDLDLINPSHWSNH